MHNHSDTYHPPLVAPSDHHFKQSDLDESQQLQHEDSSNERVTDSMRPCMQPVSKRLLGNMRYDCMRVASNHINSDHDLIKGTQLGLFSLGAYLPLSVYDDT